MTTKYLPHWLNLIGVITYRFSYVIDNLNRRLHTITIEVDFSFTIFIPSDPMRARATTFIKVYYTTLFFIRLFFGNVSGKKTPLKDEIFNLFAASSNSKLFNDLLGNITFLIEIMFLIRKYLLYLYYRPKN